MDFHYTIISCNQASLQVNSSTAITNPPEITNTIRLKHYPEHISVIKVWILDHTWDLGCTQGQIHPHGSTEEMFITPFEEIQRWQSNCDHIIPLNIERMHCATPRTPPFMMIITGLDLVWLQHQRYLLRLLTRAIRNTTDSIVAWSKESHIIVITSPESYFIAWSFDL